ncbi:hypothetical protein N802_05485 [Knoellia sinensis KCTC 19936]|uniref:Uncharacterized protein n=2 Tax=Knoellia TaxID=136099 RepID=A0A0A0J3Z1_9MICO|nr:hypothetical protein N802_05485 [Knoellia sinensis KCTC 19936]
MLRQVDLRTGSRRLVSVSDASVVRDFYTVELEDGTRSDRWEKRFAEAESRVAPMVRAATREVFWSPSPIELAHLTTWIALQFLRGPDHRRLLTQIRAQTLVMTVGMGGLAYLRHAMSEGLQRAVSAEEAEAVWDDIHSPGGPAVRVTGSEHIHSIRGSLGQAANFIGHRSWHRIRFDRRSLAINDSPVGLIPAEDHHPARGVGLANAGAVTIALDRRTLLWLDHPTVGNGDYPPSTLAARLHNQSVVFGAERFVYMHPDDADPTEGLALPREERSLFAPAGVYDFANRDRPLADVLEQIGEHDFDAEPDAIIADYTWPIPGYEPHSTGPWSSSTH